MIGEILNFNTNSWLSRNLPHHGIKFQNSADHSSWKIFAKFLTLRVEYVCLHLCLFTFNDKPVFNCTFWNRQKWGGGFFFYVILYISFILFIWRWKREGGGGTGDIYPQSSAPIVYDTCLLLCTHMFNSVYTHVYFCVHTCLLLCTHMFTSVYTHVYFRVHTCLLLCTH